MNFEELGLGPELVRAVAGLGFADPMPIQEKSIPWLVSGERDFVGLAQTGTGKTGAYGLPLIQCVDPEVLAPQAVILCPTRELCLQITNDLQLFARFRQDVRITAVYGGASIVNQIRSLKRGAHIIVATPGRLLDLIERRVIRLGAVSRAVLDEADEMLNMGFQEDIDRILGQLPENRRIWLFSATMPKSVATIARKYLDKPAEVTVGARNQSPAGISHTCYVVHENNRYEGLKRIIDFTPDMFGLVFCRTRKDTQAVADALTADGYNSEALHGDLSQPQRDQVMGRFRQGALRILVATDVAARGLDVNDITHVIHYNLPDDMEAYTHRSGRTARAGKSGASIALINPREKFRIHLLEKTCRIRFEAAQFPKAKAICEKKLLGIVDKIARTEVNQDEIAPYLPVACQALEQFSREELIARFISGEFGDILEHYRNADDINVKTPAKAQERPAKAPVRSAKGAVRPAPKVSVRPFQKKEGVQGRHKAAPERAGDGRTARFFINMGRLDKINEGAIVRLICDKSGIRSNMIGGIDLNREFSFFEVEASAAGRVVNALSGATLDGKPCLVRPAEAAPRKKHRKGEARAV